MEQSLVLSLLSLCLIPPSLARAELAPSALSLSQENFTSQLAASPHFVLFFSPRCGHCQRFAPTWDQLALKINKEEGEEREVRISKVDCTVWSWDCAVV